MADFTQIISFCESLHKNVTMETPFGQQTITPKIGNKIFCFISLESEQPSISIKGLPEDMAALKETNSATFDARYLNKKHWTGIHINSDISHIELQELIHTSFKLVAYSLTKKTQKELGLIPYKECIYKVCDS
ncbi:MAG: MmcQ/YjbR family DNA-binding protein [Candidatus Kapaibacteriales bacterium]